MKMPPILAFNEKGRQLLSKVYSALSPFQTGVINAHSLRLMHERAEEIVRTELKFPKSPRGAKPLLTICVDWTGQAILLHFPGFILKSITEPIE